jgi:WD40 repeat protein
MNSHLKWWRCLFLLGVCAAVSACSPSGPKGSPGTPERPDGGASVQPKSRYTLQGHADWITCLAFSPDSQTLASGTRAKDIILWDLATGKSRTTFTAANHVDSVAFSPDGKTLAAAALRHIELWDVAAGTKTVLYKIKEPAGFVKLVAYSRDGKLLACAGEAHPTVVLDVAGQVVATFGTDKIYTFGLAFSPDGNTVATAEQDTAEKNPAEQKRVQLWDVKNKKAGVTITTPTHFVSLAFSPDGTMLAGGTGPTQPEPEKTVVLWDAAGQKLNSFPAGRNVLYGVGFGPDGKTLVSGGDNNVVHLWDVATGKKIAALKTPALIRCVAISPDGKLVAAGLVDRTVLVWDMPAVK